MKKLSAIPVVLALTLVVAAPVSAATPNATLKSQLRVQKAKVAKLKSKLVSANLTINILKGKVVTLTGSFAQARTDLDARTTERDTANASLLIVNAGLAAQTTLTGQAAAGYVSGLSPDQLWAMIGVLYPLLPNSDLCGYGRSFFASGNYTSYTFTRYVC